MSATLGLPDAESAAAELLAKGDALHVPVDLARVCQLWPGLRVVEEPMENSGYLIDLGVQGYELVIRSADNSVRKRFTCAHELGHLVLSQHGLPWQRCVPDSRSASVERWCDRFAAALLMPGTLVLNYVRQGRIRGLTASVMQGPALFGVSGSAFRLRLTEVAALGVLEYGISEEAGEQIKLVASSRLPAESIDAAVGQLKMHLQRHPNRQVVSHEAQGLLSIVRMLKRAKSEVRWLAVICRSPRKANEAPTPRLDRPTDG